MRITAAFEHPEGAAARSSQLVFLSKPDLSYAKHAVVLQKGGKSMALSLDASSPEKPASCAVPPTPTSFKHTMAAWCALCLLIVAWLMSLDFPQVIAGDNLDGSYFKAFAFFFKNKVQLGVDTVLNYGPLGFFHHRIFDSDLFWHKFIWELVTKLAFVLTLWKIAIEGAPSFARSAVVFLLMICVIAIVREPDFLPLFVVLAHLLFILKARDDDSRWKWILSTALIVVLSLTKFTLLVLAGYASLIIVAYFLISRRWTMALVFAISLVSVFVVCWILLGQRISHMPRFIATSLQYSSGFMEAMSYFGSAGEVSLALALLAICAGCMIAFPLERNLSRQHVAALAILGLCCFLEWKHGLVRQDPGHTKIFFAFFTFLPFLLPAVLPAIDWQSRTRTALRFGASFLAFGGFLEAVEVKHHPGVLAAGAVSQLKLNLAILRTPADWHQQLDACEAGAKAQFDLPQIRARVQGATVDLFSYRQGVLLLNHLRWQPRPVFQGYATFTPALASLNAEFLRSDKAPEYLIWKLETIDGRYPAADDSLALLEIIHRYKPVLTEKGYVLLQRHHSRRPEEPIRTRTIRQDMVRLNEEVIIGADDRGPLKLSLQVHYSLWGRLQKVLYKTKALQLELRTADAQVLSYRLVPGMVEGGFLLSPLLQDHLDFFRLYDSTPGKRVVAFRIAADPQTARYYQPDVAFTLESLDGLPACRLGPDEMRPILYPFFDAAPAMVQSPGVQWTAVGEVPVLLVHPEGEIKFHIPPHVSEMSGRFGIVPAAFQAGTTDGVLFQVEYRPMEGEPQMLFQRHVDPAAQPDDRAMQSLTVALPPHCAGDLVLKTTNLPHHNSDFDWSYWTGIRFR
jgi:hypothetical protein